MLDREKAIADPELVTLVIGCSIKRADRLKLLVEYIQGPPVVVAAPDDWQSRLGKRRPAAVFIGTQLQQDESKKLKLEIKKFDPNIPVTMLKTRLPDL